LIAQTLAATGCQLLVIGRSAAKRETLAGLGIHAEEAGALPARRADVVVECTGNPEGLEMARRAVRPRGTIVLKSTYHGRTSLDFSSVVVDELTLIGSRCGPFAPALAALAEGSVRAVHMVDARYALADAVAAF